MVVFDLDEGLLNTEFLLFDITRRMIRDETGGGVLTFEDYAEYVGMDERDFFVAMKARFHNLSSEPDELVAEREANLLERIRTDAYAFMKPGMRDLVNYSL